MDFLCELGGLCGKSEFCIIHGPDEDAGSVFQGAMVATAQV